MASVMFLVNAGVFAHRCHVCPQSIRASQPFQGTNDAFSREGSARQCHEGVQCSPESCVYVQRSLVPCVCAALERQLVPCHIAMLLACPLSKPYQLKLVVCACHEADGIVRVNQRSIVLFDALVYFVAIWLWAHSGRQLPMAHGPGGQLSKRASQANAHKHPPSCFHTAICEHIRATAARETVAHRYSVIQQSFTTPRIHRACACGCLPLAGIRRLAHHQQQ